MTHISGALIPLLLLALVGCVMAVPQLPAEFYGTVLIDNAPAPAGTVITAQVENHSGSLTTKIPGLYGGSATFDERLLVGSDENDAGKTITFTVGGVKANETATYDPGTVVRLNLTAKRGSSGGTTPSNPAGGGGGGSPGGGGGTSSGPSGPTVPLQPPVVVMEYTGSGSLDSDEKGTLQYPTTIYTQNKDGRLYIDAGVRAKDMFGRALESVTLRSVPADDLPGVGEGSAVFGRALKGGPDGATFDPAVEVSFTLTPEEWERLTAGEQFVVRWYNSKTEAWEPLETRVYPSIRMVTAKVSHFTLFAVYTEKKPVTVPEATATVSWTPTTTAAGQTSPLPGDEGSTFWWRIALAVLLVLIGAVYVLRLGDDDT